MVLGIGPTRTTSMAVLVCEGVCGAPFTQQYDEAARKFGRDLGNTKRKPEAVEVRAQCVELAPKLVHTLHTRVRSHRYGAEIFECVDCKTERAF